MHELPTEIKEEIHKGNWTVKWSEHRFSEVDPDHAQEWLGARGKVGGGIVGITNI